MRTPILIDLLRENSAKLESIGLRVVPRGRRRTSALVDEDKVRELLRELEQDPIEFLGAIPNVPTRSRGAPPRQF